MCAKGQRSLQHIGRQHLASHSVHCVPLCPCCLCFCFQCLASWVKGYRVHKHFPSRDSVYKTETRVRQDDGEVTSEMCSVSLSHSLHVLVTHPHSAHMIYPCRCIPLKRRISPTTSLLQRLGPSPSFALPLSSSQSLPLPDSLPLNTPSPIMSRGRKATEQQTT